MNIMIMLGNTSIGSEIGYEFSREPKNDMVNPIYLLFHKHQYKVNLEYSIKQHSLLKRTCNWCRGGGRIDVATTMWAQKNVWG